MNLVILCTAIGYLVAREQGAAIGAAIGSGANIIMNALGLPLKIT